MKEWLPCENLDGVGVLFGSSAADIKKLMPDYKDIPDEFKRDKNKWCQLQSDWFFKGIKASSIIAKKGIDKSKALRHLGAIQASFAPSHEHKAAGVAYLASLWFDDYIPAKSPVNPQGIEPQGWMKGHKRNHKRQRGKHSKRKYNGPKG